jgi:glycosyltransferase involved in cell wall biosynthesis
MEFLTFPHLPTSSPIKLCIMSSSFRLGGLEKLLYYLCRNLDPRHFDLTICLLREKGPFIDLMVRDLKPRVHVFDLTSPLKLSVLWNIVQLLRRTDPHIIHTFGFKGDVISRCLRPFLGTSALASGVANPDLPHARWKRWLNRTTSWCVDVYWANCQAFAALGVQRLGIPAEKIKVISHGIDWNQESLLTETNGTVRDELGVAPDVPLIALLGNLRFIKGHHCVIEAAPLILRRFPQATFVFIGEDTTEGALPALAECHGLGDHFRFIGFREDPRPYLNAADLLLQPSLSEGLPWAILEAMSLGKPVIASKVGGIPEVIEHGVNGYLIPPADNNALAQAVIELLSHPQLGMELGRRGRETVKERFTLKRMVKEFETFYYELVAEAVVPA